MAVRNNFKRDRQQRVSSQHGDAVAENFVARRAAAPEIIVIHAREIIVHQRISVDAFDRAGEGKGGIDVAATSFSRGEAKNRSQSLASGKKTVPHRLVERSGFRTRFRQITIKRAVDLFLAGPKILFEIHGMEVDAGCSISITGMIPTGVGIALSKRRQAERCPTGSNGKYSPRFQSWRSV